MSPVETIEQRLSQSITPSDKSFNDKAIQDHALKNLNQELKLAQKKLDKENDLSR